MFDFRGGFVGAFRLIVPLTLLLLATGITVATRRLEVQNRTLHLTRTPPFNQALASLPGPPSPDLVFTDGMAVPVEFRLARGETLGRALADLGVAPQEAYLLTQVLGEYVDLRRLRPEDLYAAHFDQRFRLSSLQVTVVGRGRAWVSRHPEGWQGSWKPFERTVELQVVQGELQGFLESSIRQAGGPPNLAYEMAEVLQWDLDFTRDLQLGDRFQVLYEEIYLDGEFHGVGNILALAYENRGRRLEAYRFGSEGGYYDPEGRPLKKMFLRSPLRYSRITSRFSHRRFHPVLRTYRPHYGVDYGAPTGTPVRVTANGVVAFAGWDGGGGKTVRVRHPNQYLTAYLHLSRFAPGIRPGRRVRQGEVIGYVGATGLATGPHLDYRVQHRGRWINPLSIKGVPAEPLAERELPRFFAWRDALQESLETGESPRILSPDGDPAPSSRIAAAGSGSPLSSSEAARR